MASLPGDGLIWLSENNIPNVFLAVLRYIDNFQPLNEFDAVTPIEEGEPADLIPRFTRLTLHIASPTIHSQNIGGNVLPHKKGV